MSNKKKPPDKPGLCKIEPQYILDSTLWRPDNSEYNFEYDVQSWYDIQSINSKCTQKRNNHNVKTELIRSKQVILYPTQQQRDILLRWNEIYRQVYNLTVNYIKNIPPNNKGIRKIPSKLDMREIILPLIYQNINLKTEINATSFPIQSLTQALNDCLKAYKTGFSNLRNKRIRYFRIRPKRKSHHQSGIRLEPQVFSKKKNAICINSLGEMKSSSPLTGITKECRLNYNSRSNVFTLYVPFTKVTKSKVKRYNICSMDPGVRTFQTVYTPQGNCYGICSDENRVITKLIARIHKPDKGNPSGYKKHINRLRCKLKNKVTDMHWKVANFLCKKFDTIIIGNYSTKEVSSNDRNLPPQVKNHSYALAHFQFRERLISKAEEYNCHVVVQDESYTTKTCGGCGLLNDVGKKHEFKCSGCSVKWNRDINGARNILLKYLSSK